MASPRILINGAKGRMGQALIESAGQLGLNVTAAIDVGDDLASHLAEADVIVDFSSHQATRAVLEAARSHRKAVVIGTTGHSAEEKAALMALAAAGPCVWSGNYSVGVNLLFALTRRAANVLGADYDAEVIEMHHRFKMHSLRGGDVVGDHTVMFAALGERIELTHKASDRGIFARGALRAAEWVIARPAGVYDMQDVLGLK